MKADDLIKTLAASRVTIIGLAREGTALARFLAGIGADVTASDLKGAEALRGNLEQLAGLPITYVLGQHPETLLETDLLFLSPGVPLTAPIVRAARERGVPISTETRLFMELCPAPVIGVTGSSGKTTTVTLVGEMCRAAGRATYVGGNIGAPLIGYLERIRPADAVVMELSSFQLDLYRPWAAGTRGAELLPWLSQGKSPQIAAILNITPNHLDRHADMAEYTDAKAQILAHQGPEGWAILGADDPVAWGLAGRARGRVAGFSLRAPVAEGAYLDGTTLTLRRDGADQAICPVGEIKLRGWHNVANILAACAIAGAAGVGAESMAAVARQFAGVEHRLELVRERRGARYYNDSIATTPERAIAALEAFDEPIVLLAGGRDKHLPWDRWAALAAQRARHVVLFGEAAGLIEAAAREAWAGQAGPLPTLWRCGTMEEAVARAAELAGPGDVVLLSPGGTSFDAFQDFAERGKRFKALVLGLDEGVA
ncbi:MAG: UDP-N-acetylmuramoyl-L-alanine--D-glutamate ligase [Chloroflexi bacterium]|nr:UDP-N-acetylmuramoyl-L-alanine--D-glutamate ligase [Chloroflexota bacterium]